MRAKITWIGIIVGLLGMSLLTHGILLVMAVNDPSFAVEPDYERKAANWDEIQRQRRASQALGWSVDLSTVPADQPGEVDVTLRLFDDQGQPLPEAQVRLEGFHVARASRVVGDRLIPAGDGVYQARMPLRRSGIWEFRIEVRHGEDRYTDVLRKSVLSTPRSFAP